MSESYVPWPEVSVVYSAFLIAVCIVLSRVAYTNETRRVMFDDKTVCGRNAECLIAVGFGIFLGGVGIPLFVAGVLIARAFAWRRMMKSLAGTHEGKIDSKDSLSEYPVMSTLGIEAKPSFTATAPAAGSVTAPSSQKAPSFFMSSNKLASASEATQPEAQQRSTMEVPLERAIEVL